MKRKSCFHEKCNANSRGDALQGCWFLEAASNPNMEYSETPMIRCIKIQILNNFLLLILSKINS